MKKTIFFLSFSAGFILSSCIGSTGQEKEAGPDEIYFNYKISGEEGNDSVTVIVKFHEYNEYGAAVTFSGSVLLDGKQMQADSSSMTGPFYISTRQIQEFTGRHIIQVTGPDNKKYKEEFFFRPFILKPGLPDTLSREKLVLQFDGLDKRDIIRVVMTDTSFTGEGINRVDTVWNNKLTISRNKLSFLENGPVNVELIKENERPVEKGTKAGGMLSVFYTIRREFYLKD